MLPCLWPLLFGTEKDVFQLIHSDNGAKYPKKVEDGPVYLFQETAGFLFKFHLCLHVSWGIYGGEWRGD